MRPAVLEVLVDVEHQLELAQLGIFGLTRGIGAPVGIEWSPFHRLHVAPSIADRSMRTPATGRPLLNQARGS
jgi:hypothetical protein